MLGWADKLCRFKHVRSVINDIVLFLNIQNCNDELDSNLVDIHTCNEESSSDNHRFTAELAKCHRTFNGDVSDGQYDSKNYLQKKWR